MSTLQVEIVHLEPMRVAAFYGFGAEPEHAAVTKLIAWAQPRGLIDSGTAHRVFGFNNPSPAAGSPNYGYEFWLQLTPDEVEALAHDGLAGVGELKSFAGGDYAVTRCCGVEAVPDAWRALVTWCEDSAYDFGAGQCLEQQTGPLDGPLDKLEFALYQSIVA